MTMAKGLVARGLTGAGALWLMAGRFLWRCVDLNPVEVCDEF